MDGDGFDPSFCFAKWKPAKASKGTAPKDDKFENHSNWFIYQNLSSLGAVPLDALADWNRPRPSSTDVITITDIVINSVSDEEYATADIQSLTAPLHADNRIYTLSGMRAKDMKAGNIYIKNNKKIFIN